jgi:hypothetical protein
MCAYALWESEHRPHGRDEAHWLQAEQQLMAARAHEAGLLEVSARTKTGAPTAARRRMAAKTRRQRRVGEVVAL